MEHTQTPAPAGLAACSCGWTRPYGGALHRTPEERHAAHLLTLELEADARARAARPAPEPQVWTLVACSASKLNARTQARHLYTGQLFTASARVAEAGDGWLILSALHGVVHPDDVLEPYDRSLQDLTASSRRAWGSDVAADIRKRIPFGSRLVILAGAMYRDPILPALRQLGYTVELPLEGLGIGQQKAALNAMLAGRTPAPTNVPAVAETLELEPELALF